MRLLKHYDAISCKFSFGTIQGLDDVRKRKGPGVEAGPDQESHRCAQDHRPKHPGQLLFNKLFGFQGFILGEVLARKDIYKITVLNWEKYNGSLKKSHKCILLSTRFLDDSKIRSLSPVNRLLYLSCLLVAGESQQSQIEVTHESLVFHSGVKSGSLQSQLMLLQSLQLVTVDNLKSLLDLEWNRKEENRIERSTSEVKKPSLDPPKKPEVSSQKNNTASNRKVWEAYCESYLARYHVDPVRNATVNALVSNLVKKLGEKESIDVVRFYLTHNDSFFLRNTHAFKHCLSSAETLRTQMLRGKPITQSDVRRFENEDHFQSQINRIEKGEV